MSAAGVVLDLEASQWGEQGTRVRRENLTTGLYVALTPGEGALERLLAALSAVPVDAVLVAMVEGNTHDPSEARTLVEAAQAKDCAALIEQDARLARDLRADGVHLGASTDSADRYAEARALLGPRSIIGATASASRHEAMVLAEAGADYVGFGKPIGPRLATYARGHRLELVAWWAEIFQVPCVAFDVLEADEAAELADAGADFLGSPLGSHEPPSTLAERMRTIHSAVSSSKQPALARERSWP